LVEQRIENPRVGGSIPPQATSVYAPQRPIRVLGRFYKCACFSTISEVGMRVFISWSGQVSHKLAAALRDWLPNVIQALDPWISSSDIEKGETWFASISDALVKAEGVGIFCLTSENLTAPWLAFEAGALAGSDRARVATLRFNVPSDQVKPPLSLFQATDASSMEDVFKMIEMLNRRLQVPLSDSRLKVAFDTHWPRLDEALKKIPASAHVPASPAPNPTDLMREILAVVRRIEKDRTMQVLSSLTTFPDGSIGFGGPLSLSPSTGPLSLVTSTAGGTGMTKFFTGSTSVPLSGVLDAFKSNQAADATKFPSKGTK
jgi:hypothetical protein